MTPVVQAVLPVVTLILGYLLKVWSDSLESKREVARRRVSQKEKAYAEIIAKLHELFETYRLQTLRKTSSIAGISIWGSPDESVIPQQYDDLITLVFKHNLYMQPGIIQALVDLKLTDFRLVIHEEPREGNEAERIKFLEEHADRMWAKAKLIISEMRKEIGLAEYPEDLLMMWR